MGTSQAGPVAVVAGVGPGLGGALCRRLAAAGFRVVGLARSSDYGTKLAAEIGSCPEGVQFFPCDLTDPLGVERVLGEVESGLGPPEILVYNAGHFVHRPFTETSVQDFSELWSVNCLGAMICARRLVPGMLALGRGKILFTGATASVKAGAQFAAFGSAKFALRGLAQSLARELGPQGIHVAHVLIDGILWTPKTTRWPGVTREQCLLPEAVAESYLMLVNQERSAWTHELDLRPDVESF